MAFCDSDIFFLKPFDVRNGSRDKQIRFSSIEVPQKSDHKLILNSIDLMGLLPSKVKRCAYDDPFVTWHRPTAIAMQDYLTKLHNRPWHEAIGSKLMFSEFALYIMFVSYIQKSNPFHYEDNTILCKTLWDKEAAKKTDIAAFCSGLAPEQVAVCIQSLLGIDVGLLNQQLNSAMLRHQQTSQNE